MSSTKYVHKMNQAELCALLEVDERGLRKLTRRRGLPAPVYSDGEGDLWLITAVRDWLTATNYRSLRALLLKWWPDATAPADLVETRLMRRDRAEREPVAVLQHWQTKAGDVVVAWPLGGCGWVDGEDLAQQVPNADAYLVIGLGWGIYGPDVWAYPGARPGAGCVNIEWCDLARVLGRPAPWWPYLLRRPDLILAWEPGDPLVRHVGVLPIDIQPLLRMALLYPPDHFTHRAMIQTAQVISNYGDATDSSDLSILNELLSDERISEKEILLAADAAPNYASGRREQDETVARAGWREVLHRSDRLAEQCVHVLREWGDGSLWPYAHPITILRGTAAGVEFLSRLEPAPERTAVYYAIDRERTARPMLDPATDIPVAVPDDQRLAIYALAPQRLPTTSPLAELILENPIWVRTQDGTLYPAPYHHYHGLNWGYNGSGPAALAALAYALLADITAEGTSSSNAAPDGLYELFQHEWPESTVLTRAQLETARDA